MSGEHLIRTFLVDDTTSIRKLVRHVLEASGQFEVVAESGDGQDAVDRAGAVDAELIVLDVAMPRMDGLTALPLLHKAKPDARIVMFSGFTEDRLAAQTKALGASAYLEKGARPAEIVSTLLSVMHAA